VEGATIKTIGITYDRAGNGERLLLLHGTGGSRRQWALLTSILAARRELVAVDLPGHGDSDPPPDGGDHTPVGYAATIAALLDRLGIGAAHVAGDSVGGWTALELAKLGRARSVVAIAPAGLWARRDPWRCVLKLWAMYRLGRLTAPLTDRALRSEAGRTRLLRGTVAKPLNLSEKEARDLIETYTAPPPSRSTSRRPAAHGSATALPSRRRSRWRGAITSGSSRPKPAGRTSSRHRPRRSRSPAAVTSRSGTIPNSWRS
jgi:pimeloyl-ACP methyl ester carboxylesterase